MDTGDWIFLAQTVVVLLTGGIVFYYAKETHKLRKTTERHMQITAKTGLLAAQMQHLSVIEMQNASYEARGKMIHIETGDVFAEINKLETEITHLASESD